MSRPSSWASKQLVKQIRPFDDVMMRWWRRCEGQLGSRRGDIEWPEARRIAENLCSETQRASYTQTASPMGFGPMRYLV
jgi:hypothetical protein